MSNPKTITLFCDGLKDNSKGEVTISINEGGKLFDFNLTPEQAITLSNNLNSILKANELNAKSFNNWEYKLSHCKPSLLDRTLKNFDNINFQFVNYNPITFDLIVRRKIQSS